MLVATRASDRRSRLRPCQRALVALVYLHEHIALVKIAAGFGFRRVHRACLHQHGPRPSHRPCTEVY